MSDFSLCPLPSGGAVAETTSGAEMPRLSAFFLTFAFSLLPFYFKIGRLY